MLWGVGGALILLLWTGLSPLISLRSVAGSVGGKSAKTTVDPPGASSTLSTSSALSTSSTSETTTTQAEPAAATAGSTVDVVVYGTQTSGIAAVREMVREDPALRVAVISSGDYLESPLAQGLCVEDARNVDEVAGGAYKEWRERVIAYYADRGVDPFTPSGRFVYEPAVATRCLWSLLQGSSPDQVLFYSGTLLAASDDPSGPHVDVHLINGSSIRINTRYFIDASVEADLSRMLGASYRIGRSEDVYNDRVGPVPPYPSAADDFATAPQRFSTLLTLRVYPSGQAPRVLSSAAVQFGFADLPSIQLSSKAVSGFATSWTMSVATLPGGDRELNESWNDYPNLSTAFQWIFEADKRAGLTKLAVERSLSLIADLQDRGYGNVGVDVVPQYPYVREGPRVVGVATYTVPHILSGARDDVVALGCYTLYDRHDRALPNQPNQIDKTTWVQIPMEALLVEDHPLLVVSTAISTSYRAYSSPVRTELTRANLGGAAGVIMVLATRLHCDPSSVPYFLVRLVLQRRGYEVP